jgi:hypothetical protein
MVNRQRGKDADSIHIVRFSNRLASHTMPEPGPRRANAGMIIEVAGHSPNL